MKDRKRYLTSHYQIGIRTALRFRFLEEIDKHKNSESCVWCEHESIVKELVEEIKNGSLTRYNLNDDYIRMKYGIEDLNTSMLLCEIAFYQAGCDAAVTHSDPTMDYLKEIGQNMESGFFDGYQLKQEVLAKLVESLEGKAMNIVEQSRDIQYSKNVLQNICQEINTELDEEAIIEKIDKYYDFSCLEISPDVSVLAWMLNDNEYWEEFYRLLEILKYFPLQGYLIDSLGNIKDIRSVINTVESHNGKKSIHYLLREQFFSKICEEGSLLSDNLKEQSLTGEDKIYIKESFEDFQKNSSEYVSEMVCIWLDIFGKEELTDWISKKKNEAERKHEKYGRRELEVVNKIVGAYVLTSEEIDSFRLNDKSFHELITLAGIADDKNVCRRIIEALQKNIFAEQFYPPMVMNDNWFEKARTVYHCLNKSGVDGLAISKEEHRPFEGYRVDLGVSMRNARQEAYWMAILLLGLEDNADEIKFKQFLDVLLQYTKPAIDSLSDDVFVPYYIAELLVSQVMQGEKDFYERMLIEEIPYLVFVIRVLTGNDGVFSDEIKQLLKKRIISEWETERKLLSQHKTHNLEFYDDYVKKIVGGK